MIPKIKLLFLGGSLDGQKLMFDSSLPQGADQHRKFLISKDGDMKCDEIPEGNIMSIQYSQDAGWVFKIEKAIDMQISWYIVPRSTATIGDDYLDGHKIRQQPNIEING